MKKIRVESENKSYSQEEWLPVVDSFKEILTLGQSFNYLFKGIKVHKSSTPSCMDWVYLTVLLVCSLQKPCLGPDICSQSLIYTVQFIEGCYLVSNCHNLLLIHCQKNVSNPSLWLLLYLAGKLIIFLPLYLQNASLGEVWKTSPCPIPYVLKAQSSAALGCPDSSVVNFLLQIQDRWGGSVGNVLVLHVCRPEFSLWNS